MKINIVIDNKNSWFYKDVYNLRKEIKKIGYSSKIYLDQSNIPENSDITFFLSCEKYVTKDTRNKSRYNIVVHASDLPKGKGMSPATWQILEGKNKIQVTLFEIADGIDEGNYYLKDSFELDGSELVDEWQGKLYLCIEKMIIKFIKNVNNLKPIKQKGNSTEYKRRGLKDSELNINKSLKSQINLLRVVDNEKYPAFIVYKGKKYILKIYNAKDIKQGEKIIPKMYAQYDKDMN